MKAAQLTEYGGKEAISINELPELEVGEGQILIDVKAAGVNPFDWKVQAGYMKDFIPLNLPVTLGGDFAGVVTQVGSGVEDIQVGDEVYGQANILAGGSGSFADKAIAVANVIALKPKSIDFVQAGGLPLVGSSALQALTEHINLQSGQKILIQGGAGGIGSVAIQIAKYLGATVIATASPDDLEFVKSLGADQIIDYTTQKFEDLISEVDAVFDTAGGDTTNRSISVLKRGGILVSMVQPADEETMKEREVEAIAQQTKITKERLEELSKLVDSGVVHIEVEKTFPLEETAEALSYLKETPPKGKVVITV